MTLINPQRRNLQQEETNQRYAVAESNFKKAGASINFVNLRQYDTKEFKINGAYANTPNIPFLGFDGIFVFPFRTQIINLAIYANVIGGSGTTELDVKVADASSGVFNTILSETAKIVPAASNFAFALSYDITEGPVDQIWTVNPTPPTGVTVAELITTPTIVEAGSGLRVDLLQAMAGGVDVGMLIFHRPG